MIPILTVLACMIPTAIYVALIYRVDRYEKEPIWLLSAVFLWGAIPAIFFTIIFNGIIDLSVELFIGEGINSMTSAVVVAPLVEETVKGLALLGVFFMRRRDIDSPLDGIIYGAMVGMGFAMVENYFYFSSEFASGGFEAFGINVFYRAIVFGLNHALFSSMFGLGIALARLTKREFIKILAPVFGWAVAVTLHGVHNATVGLGDALCFIAPLADWGGVLLTIVIITWSLRQEQDWLNDYLKEEVVLGTLTMAQYELATDLRYRREKLWDALAHVRLSDYFRLRRFLTLLSKLAYQKHHADIHPEDEHVKIIRDLRDEIEELSIRV